MDIMRQEGFGKSWQPTFFDWLCHEVLGFGASVCSVLSHELFVCNQWCIWGHILLQLVIYPHIKHQN